MGLIGGGLKIVRVLRQAEWWPFFLYDYFAAIMLIVGGLLVLRRKGGERLLAGGWGFGVAMCYGSFFGHLENWLQRTRPDLGFEKEMSIWVGALLAINVVGLCLALAGSRPSTGLAAAPAAA
jgi:mannose/fructose/N-acetylgalactosamine-specific phosphotransferase system component IIC